MSIVVGLTALDDESLRRIEREPALYFRAIEPENEAIYFEALASMVEQPLSLISKLKAMLGLRQDSAKHELPPAIDTPGIVTDLDKAWNAIHFILNGDPEEGEPPLDFIMQGGAEIDSNVVEEQRIFFSDEVRHIHEALSAISDHEFEVKFEQADFTGCSVYPEDMWDVEEDRQENLEYCLGHLKDLRDFIKQAADNGYGMIVGYG